MLKNKHLAKELEVLFEAQEWKMIAKWFSYWKDLNEKIDKCLLFGHFFMPDHFRNASPKFHRRLLRSYFSDENEYEAAPRGFSKTTLFQCGMLFECVNELQKFIAVVEKTFTEAAEVIGGVRDVCAESDLLILCYGDLIHSKKNASLLAGISTRDKDAEGDVFINGVRLRAKGFDQPIRGLKSGAYRPTKILCDDIEQDKHIDSPDQRAKYRARYDKGIQPAVDPEGTIKVFGTILHEDSLLNNLIRQHGGKIYMAYYLETDTPEEWASARPICDEIVVPDVGKVRLLWASRWSWDRLMRKKQDMRSENKSSHAFEQEYRNKPLAEEDRKFKREWLYNPNRTIKMSDLLKAKVLFRGFAMIDVADSTSASADYTAAVVILVDQWNNWYRVFVEQSRRNINGLINLIFDIWGKFSPYGLEKIGVERKAFSDQIEPLLKEAMDIRGVYPVVEELKPMGRSKEGRILGALQGRYEYAKIWTVTDDSGKPVGDTNKLLEQLYNFPASKNDDLSDAEAYGADIAEAPAKQDDHVTQHSSPEDDPFAEGGSPEPHTVMQGDEMIIRGNPSHHEDPF